MAVIGMRAWARVARRIIEEVWGGQGRLSVPPCPVRVAHTTPALFPAGRVRTARHRRPPSQL
jgi:hypothetical protein